MPSNPLIREVRAGRNDRGEHVIYFAFDNGRAHGLTIPPVMRARELAEQIIYFASRMAADLDPAMPDDQTNSSVDSVTG